MIHLTDAASDRILEMLDPGELGLRIEVVSGGCSGFQYLFSKVTEADDCFDDMLVRASDGEVLLFVDPTSAEKIDGSMIDYESSLMKQEFVVNNPSSACCGCGKSFT